MNKNLFDLTAPQKSIFITEQYFKGSSINNICGVAFIHEVVNFDLLKKAINLVVEHNENFNIRLCMENNEIKQYVVDYVPFDIEIVNVSTDEDLVNVENDFVKQVFDTNSKLFDFKLFRFPNGSGGFIPNLHHLISDSWTLGLIAKEVVGTYANLVDGKEPDFSVVSSYSNYIEAEKEYIESDKFKKDKVYWNSIFDTIPEPASIPAKKSDMDTFSCEASRITCTIPKEITESIQNFCKNANVSVFNFFMAIYAIYIGRVSNLDDFVIGTPILNRCNFKEKNTMGMFINIVPYRINLQDNQTFKSFVCTIAKDSLSMLRHQKYSYQYILEDLRSKNPSLPNLYNIVMSYQITKTNLENNISYDTNWIFNGSCGDDLDIHLLDLNDTGSINIAYDYRLNKYDKEEISAIHERILHMIHQVLNHEDVCTHNIEIVTSKEKYELLYGFNNTDLEYDDNISFISYFEEQVNLHPNDIAITFQGQNMDYETLNKKSNSLAYLLRENGVTNNSIVGIMLDRSFEMMISILAVLKSGGGYIPIDPDYPDNRINYMLKDSNCQILLTKQDLNKDVHCNNVIYVDLNKDFYINNTTNLNSISKPDDLSYLIYTSGSTGLPKGVMLTQKSLVNFHHAMRKKISYLDDNVKYRIASITTVSFDIFAFETLISLANGLHLFMTNSFEQKSTEDLERLIVNNKIEIIQTTPSVMRFHLDNLKDTKNLSSLKYIILAGEQLPFDLVDRIKNTCPNCTVYNGYGPSETTIFSSVQDATNLHNINIGKPIANTQFYILDNHKNLLPKHYVGEIYIAGDGLGKGYLAKPDLTTKSFLPNPFCDGSLFYKTGDLGVWLDDGCICCKGRSDNQVKLRGLRIELGEIEEKINSFKPSIKSAVIVRNQNGTDFLYAFIESSEIIDISSLKAFLISCLPNYMVPSYFVVLEELPKTPNGKTDRKSLKTYPISDMVQELEIVPPQSELEKIVFDLLADIIGNKHFSILDDFFSIGMDSLNLIRFAAKIQNEFDIQVSVKELYDFSSIRDFADFLNKAPKSNKIYIEKVHKKDFYALSSAQKRVYLACKLNPNSVLYNMPGYIRLPEDIDVEKLTNCLFELIYRHDVLHTCFVQENGEIVSKLLSKDEVNFNINTIQVSSLEDAFVDFVKPFSLDKAPLLHCSLVKVSNVEQYLLLDLHHIICDGLSLNLFIDELCKLYEDTNLEPLSLSYIDYAEWENVSLQNGSLKDDKDFWVTELSDLPVLNMPLDHVRPEKSSYKGNKLFKKIDEQIMNQIYNFCNKVHITPYMFLLACYHVLLSNFCMQEDVIVGSPIANRIPDVTDSLLGMFVNNIVTKSVVKNDISVFDFCMQIKETVLNSFSHQSYPFNELVNDLGLIREGNRNPIFDTMFIYQNENYPIVKLGDTVTTVNLIPTYISKFDFSFEIVQKEHYCDLNIEYSTDLWECSTIESLADTFLHIIYEMLKNQNSKLGELHLVNNQQQNLILNKFNNTKTVYQNSASLHSLFEEQVKKTPNHIAIVYENESLTYEQLNKKSNQLAHYLRANGITKESIVCILLDKSLEMIIAILGILKAGGAYLPIDVNYPKNRIDYMIRDSASKMLLTNLAFIEKSNSTIKSICIDLTNENIYSDNENTENLDELNTSTDLGYVMYTSGSTGNPKGTMIEQKSIIRLVENTNYITFTEQTAILQTGSIVFDACTFEIWGALLHGCELHLIKKSDLLDTSCLETYLITHKIHTLWLTAPLFNQLCEDNPHMFNHVKYLLTGGDVLSPKHINMVRVANPNLQVINGYGPTENTTFSCCFPITNTYNSNIPIGYPISNSTCYVVSSGGMLLPVGFAGELWVGGDGVARGYLNNSELTSQKFIKNPFAEGRLYKTGDLTRWLPDGSVEFLGRIDNQVKIRGFRIELNEISSTILEYTGMKECATVVQLLNDEKTICSYFVANSKVDISSLKTYLKTKLPTYMLPVHMMQLDKLPINTNGKIDKHALPTNFKKELRNRTCQKPKNKTEEKLLTIYQKLLKDTDISVTDSFFDLGGDSLGAMKIEIEALSMGLSIRYADIFKYPSIRELANCINTSPNVETSQVLDYSKYDTILKKNSLDEDVSMPYTSMGNVLLSGFTGFLGAHILDSFIKNETGNIYCLIRAKNNMSAMDRLKNVLHFYFNEKYDKYINKRIFLVEGDITFDNLGLDDKDYKKLGHTITTVIHSAAMVKHFGIFSEFEAVNINGTKRIIHFCEDFDLRLMHISTISVSGNALAEQSFVEHNFKEDKDFKENDFYIGQNIENLYIKSKFEAECLVFDAILRGLKAYVLRMGNLTSRFTEGKFQQNHFENAFVNRFKSILQIGYAPDYLLDSYVEFTPIDFCGDAIIALGSHFNENFSVFHLLNEKHVTMDRLFTTLTKLGVPLKIVSSDEFVNILDALLQDEEKKNYLEGIINDLNADKKLVYDSNIKIKSDFTTAILEKVGFEWPYIDTRYIHNYLKYLADIGYFNIKLN